MIFSTAAIFLGITSTLRAECVFALAIELVDTGRAGVAAVVHAAGANILALGWDLGSGKASKSCNNEGDGEVHGDGIGSC